MNKYMRASLLCLALAVAAAAQVTTPTQPGRTGIPAGSPPALAAGPSLADLLAQTEQASQAAALDLARLRVEKWKADSGVKQQMQHNSESLQRNLTAALPTIMSQVRANPESFAANFKLYRNLQALYDVFLPLTQAADMFAPRPEAQTLVADFDRLDGARRSFADYLERLAAQRDSEVIRLRNQVQTLLSAAATAPPKKIIVDENEPAKKPVRKKKAATKPKPKTETQPQEQPSPAPK